MLKGEIEDLQMKFKSSKDECDEKELELAKTVKEVERLQIDIRHHERVATQKEITLNDRIASLQQDIMAFREREKELNKETQKRLLAQFEFDLALALA